MKNTFLEFLHSDRRFLLTGHANPDGDCLGAEVGLYHLLMALGRECSILNPDPVPVNQHFLLQGTPIGDYRTKGTLPPFDTLILLDCAQLSRLGEMESPVRAALANGARSVAVIDHHIGSDQGDGSVCFVDPTAPATGGMVFELWQAAGLQPSPTAAQGMFLSLVADTGWFKYSNTDPRALGMASDLVALGVQPDRIYDQIYRNNHPRSVDLLARALAGHRLLLGGRYATVALDRTLMDQATRIGFDTDQLMDPLRSIAGVEVVALFKELYQDSVKLSLRASGEVDVQAIAKKFGGGGHRKAAGATVAMPLVHALAAVEERVRQALPSVEDPSG